MQQHLSKRKQLALRFFTYGVMTLAVAVISVICLLFVLGYRFSLEGYLEQRALLQFRSTPNSATVLIDDKPIGVTTPGKKRQAPGEYDVRMELEGYHDWEKKVDLTPGSLLWLNYTRFVPESIVTQSVREFDGLADALISPDRRWMVLYEEANLTLTLADLRNEDQLRFNELELPREIFEKDDEVGTLAMAEWDFGGRYLLLEHRINDKKEFVIVDRTAPDDTVNISRKLNIDIEKAHFAGTNGEELFALTKEGDIRKLNLDSETISRPLVRNVQEFMLYRSDRIAFTAARDGEQIAGVYQDGEEEIVVRTFADKDPKAHAALNRYYGDYYLSVAHGKEVEIIKDPFEDGEAASRTFASFQFEPGVRWLTFSNNGRFVLAQSGKTFATYDLERDTHSQTELPKDVSTKLRWLDDYHIWTDAGGEVTMMEFDGANRHVLVEATSGFDVSLSENGEKLFSITRNDEGVYQLQSSDMVLD